MHVGIRIKEAREERGMSQQQAADLMEVSRELIAKVEAGQRALSLDALYKFCDNCHISADWMLGLSEVKKPKAELRGASEYTGLSGDAIQTIKYTLMYKNVLDFILSNEGTLEIFNEMLSHTLMASYYANQAAPMQSDAKPVLMDYSLMHELLAGRCAENIVKIIRDAGDISRRRNKIG